MLTRILDMTIVLLLAVIVLLPRPSVSAKPAAQLDAEALTHVAELQAELLADPGAVEPSLAIADHFLDGKRPEWALAALSPALERAPSDHRLHRRKALALADHFVADLAYEEAKTALALCDSGSTAPCGAADRSRLELMTSSLLGVKDIDMRKDPNAAKVNMIKGLRPTYLPPHKAKAAPVKP